MSFNAREKFFFEHAGYSYDPKIETKEQGRIRSAKAMAKAEERAQTLGWYLVVEETDEFLAEHKDGNFDVVTSHSDLVEGYEEFRAFDVMLNNEKDEPVASLGQVTFAKTKAGRRSYERILFAELALEALPERKEEQSA